jgi:hypothetical protein
VNCFNVKIGKARDLCVRERDYWRTFGLDNVLFRVIAITSDIEAAETAILRSLKSYRKLSPKGARMDWLERISVDSAIAIAHQALSAAGIRYQHAPHCYPDA